MADSTPGTPLHGGGDTLAASREAPPTALARQGHADRPGRGYGTAPAVTPAPAPGRGLFLVLEGGDNTGKSTQAGLLVAWL